MDHRLRLRKPAIAAGALLTAALLPVVPATAAAKHCAGMDRVKVPGAAQQDAPSCLSDITTTGLTVTGHTDASDWATLTSARTKPQPTTPGFQVDGYFPDDSTTNDENNKKHDSQFVMRFPDRWNGKLFISGAPGVRKQYSVDRAISDWAVAHGYAFAATDKGNTGTAFYDNAKGHYGGKEHTAPGDAILEWHYRVTELTRAAQATVQQVYKKRAAKTYMTGISNGGYLTRWALEHHPELYDGGVDWEGTLFTPKDNLLTFLPPTLKHYPKYALTGSKADHDAIIRAGFAKGSESLWPVHYGVYWDLTQRTYREELDPTYDGATKGGTAFCPPGSSTPLATCDADYDYSKRPQAVHDAVTRVSLRGNIGKPMLTLHGSLDSLLPIAKDSDLYDPMVKAAGKGSLHRYYVIQAGNHVDSFADTNTAVRPILPCYYDALLALDSWVTKGIAPPRSGTVARPTSGDEANECALPGTQKRSSGSTSPRTRQPGTISGSSGSSGSSASSGSSGATGSSSGGSASSGLGVGRSLASTGLASGLPAGALVLLAGAFGLRRRRATIGPDPTE